MTHWKNAMLRVLVLGLWAAAGCSRPLPPQVLRYTFSDGGTYRVDCTYNAEKEMRKLHQGKVFSRTRDGVFVKSSLAMRVESLPGGHWRVAYTLLRLRIHDREGRFKMEVGPESGEVQWYSEKQPLEAYLGSVDWNRYQALARMPLARVSVRPDGAQLPNGLEFNFDWLRLLGKNRVYGDYLSRGVKVPPVLMTIFDASPVAAGGSWEYQGNSLGARTRFTLTALTRDSAHIAYASELNLKPEELAAVKNALQLSQEAGLELKSSRMRITGGVEFNRLAGRPETAVMDFDKRYEMTLPQELWRLQETEHYELSVHRTD
jgi:hypothetical protein